MRIADKIGGRERAREKEKESGGGGRKKTG
jgi:hypothetical protein